MSEDLHQPPPAARSPRARRAVAAAFVLALVGGIVGWAGSAPAFPTHAWELPIPQQEVPRGLASLSAKDCGACHQAIYAEWKDSIHAHALADPQFQAEWKKDGVYLCGNCHVPLQNQQPDIVLGIENEDHRTPITRPNPGFDPALREEAITCAVCHVRDGAIIGPYGDSAAPHPVRRDPEHLSERLCIGCHEVAVHLDGRILCSLRTGSSWEAGPYAERGVTCIACHMPEIRRHNAPGGPLRPSNLHTFVGAGIPKFADQPLPQPWVSGVDVYLRRSRPSYRPGETATITVTLVNARAGHEIPTGDVERFLLLTIEVVDGAGQVLARRSEHIGERWEWWPEPRRLSDTSLQPLERRSYELNAELPAELASATLRVVLTNNRINAENAKYDALVDYPRGIEVFRREEPLLSE